jgi:hypothetical protein
VLVEVEEIWKLVLMHLATGKLLFCKVRGKYLFWEDISPVAEYTEASIRLTDGYSMFYVFYAWWFYFP